MDTNNQTNTEALRKTSSYSFCAFDISEVRARGILVKDLIEREFRKDHGNILPLLMEDYEFYAMQSLLQFYDSELRCFTFQDYQLAPTLEEYSFLLGISITSSLPFVKRMDTPDFEAIAKALGLRVSEVRDNWVPKDCTCGLPLGFLLVKADEFAKVGSWKSFNTILAVMIYGMVIFPSFEKFVDVAAISVFMNDNLVPIILADTYYVVHSRHGQKGRVMDYMPLLYRWFNTHLPKRGAFVDYAKTMKWSSRIIALTSYDIVWNTMSSGSEIITSCGEFPNVPLMGTKGCISYNPILARRQLGYPLNEVPIVRQLTETIFFANDENPILLNQIVVAWSSVHKKGTVFFGQKGNYAFDSYTDWLKDRVSKIRLSYKREAPLYSQPGSLVESLVPDFATSCSSSVISPPGFVRIEVYKQLQSENSALKEQLQAQAMDLAFALQDKKRLSVEAEQKDQVLKAYGLLEETKRAKGGSSSSFDQMTKEFDRVQEKLKNMQIANEKLKAKHGEEIRVLKKQLRKEESNAKESLERRKELEVEAQSRQEQMTVLSKEVEDLKTKWQYAKDGEYAAYTMLRGRDIHVAKLVAEIHTLKAQVAPK